MKNKIKKRLALWEPSIIVFFFSMLLILPLPYYGAFAQENVLEEILVTARRREENLQKTPAAVSALTDLMLRESGVHNLYDLNQVAPNIDVHPANGNGQVANVYIRGVGQRSQAPMIDSGVGIYIDDVYLGRADAALLDVNDINNVQVLRGPQGTLFGKNTTGGAIIFSTNRPTDELEGSIEVRAGNYGRQDTYGVINIPLSERLYSRLSVARIKRDGYLLNGFDGNSYANEDRVSAIGQLRWLATDDLTIDFNLNYSDTDQLVRLQECVLVPGLVGWQAALANALQVLPSTGRTYEDFCQDAAQFGDERDVISDLGGGYRAESKGFSATANWAIRDNLSFKSISAWRYTLGGIDRELDQTGIPLLHSTQLMHPSGTVHETDQYTQEFQFTGQAFDYRLDYIVGIFLFSEDTDNDQKINQLGPFFPGVNGLFMFNGNASKFDAENTASAVYAQGDWALSDNWRVTGGLRYTDEKRRLDRDVFTIDPTTLDANGGPVFPAFEGAWAVNPATFSFNPEFALTPVARSSGEVSDDDVSILASLQYLILDNEHIDDGSLYLSFSESFLSGGLSQAPSGVLKEFKPEEVHTVEAGFKLDLLDSRLRANVAVFYSDYENRQLTTLVFEPVLNTVAADTINAEESSIAGIEIETTWLPAPNLQLILNATFNDGDIDKFSDVQLTLANPAVLPANGCSRANLTVVQIDSCPNDRSGENLPRLPQSSVFVMAQYDFDTSIGNISPRLQLSHKSDIEYCFDAASCASGLWLEDGQFDLSARITWISPDEQWIGAIWGSNLTDETYLVGGTALTETFGAGGIAVNLPAMYGMELKYSF